MFHHHVSSPCMSFYSPRYFILQDYQRSYDKCECSRFPFFKQKSKNSNYAQTDNDSHAYISDKIVLRSPYTQT